MVTVGAIVSCQSSNNSVWINLFLVRIVMMTFVIYVCMMTRVVITFGIIGL